MALAAREAGYKAIMVPFENSREASVVTAIDVLPVKTLSQVVAFLTGFSRIAPEKPEINNLFLLNLVLRGPNRNRQYSILAGLDANRLIVSLTVQKGFSLQNPTCWY